MLNKLTPDQIDSKVAFIENYIKARNAADGSLVDANANVTQKDIATMETELYKFETIQLNRAIVCHELEKTFGKELADQYLEDIKNHLIYIHDETSLKPYCVSISMYPFLFEGTRNIGGTSKAPKNLRSFCGAFNNLVYQVASGFAGAVATVEFLMYFDYFARKSYGANYLETNRKEVAQELQGVVYTLNQPAAARGNQSVFWNISVFDKFYFESLFGTFYFPDGTQPVWDSLEKLQKFFMDWFRVERTKELLTFPVVTAAMLIDPEEKRPMDTRFEAYCAEQMSKGLSFFVYMSDTADSLASCCRLRNELADNEFSYSLGAGGVSTGSIQVITLNLNRAEQRYIRSQLYPEDKLRPIIERIHKYLVAHRNIQKKHLEAGLLPVYKAGYINIDKQFCTIGINGAVEAAEFYRVRPSDNEEYKNFIGKRLKLIYQMNKEAYKTYGFRFNTEFVPAESLGVKNAKWDKEDGLKVKRDCYNSYFYAVEDPTVSILEKMALHGKEFTQYLDGGSALHLNLEQLPTVPAAIGLMRAAARLGVNYWTFNTLSTICDACDIIDPRTLSKCPKCGKSDHLDYATRVIGYLKRVSCFSSGRQKEHSKRHYAIIGAKRKEDYEI